LELENVYRLGQTEMGAISMSYLLFIGLGWWLTVLSTKNGIPIDDTTWLCLAILTAGEVISWRCKK
jgi:hypothetical protein